MGHIEAVDLNLLGPLAALLDERHVSRAAERVAMSQPAMSRALQRLRDTLGDELLVRTPRGYQLTPRAERIQRQLAGIMPRLEILFADDVFEPRTAAELFRLAGTDYTATVLGPALFQQVFRQSPHSTLRFQTWNDEVFDDLDRGLVDLVFFGIAPPAPLRSEELFIDRFVCVMSPDNPLSHMKRLTLDDYLRCSHVVVNVVGEDQPLPDRHLQGLGTPRKAALSVPFHSVAPFAVPGTALVATLPSRLVAHYADDPNLHIVAAPIEIEAMDYRMSWHPRLDDDPAQRWLRDTIRSISVDIMNAGGDT